jgi:hypothetical protein
MRWFGSGSSAGWRQIMSLARRWGDRPELHKPEIETELPDSDLPDAETRAAIERERARRTARNA